MPDESGVGGDPLDDVPLSLNRPIRVLHVDDDPELLDLASTALEDASDRLTIETETSASAGLDWLDANGFDCLVSDYQMPGRDGLEFLAAVRDRDTDLPFILFTGKGSEEIAARAISAGVSDYLQKQTGLDHYTVLANRIETAVDHYRAKQRVRHSIEALDAARDGIAVFDADGAFRYVNESYAELYGYDPEELIGSGWEHLYSEQEIEHYADEIIPTMEAEGGWTGECECLHRDGSVFRSTHSISQFEDGGHVCVIHHGSVESESD